MPDPAFWRNKRVFVTGHTGFKGGWLTLWLSMLGAKVTGYALPPNTQPSFFEAVSLEGHLTQNHLDNINDYATLKAALNAANPEIIPRDRYARWLRPVQQQQGMPRTRGFCFSAVLPARQGRGHRHRPGRQCDWRGRLV